MEYLSFFYKSSLVVLLFLFFSGTNLTAQQSSLSAAQLAILKEKIRLETKTSAKVLSANKLILIVDVYIPKGWELKVVTGYQSMWETARDTVDLALKFPTSSNYQIMERLKSVRKPIGGYYYKEVTFAQTLRVNHKEVPFCIDAALELFFVHKNGSAFFEVSVPCLLKVCKDRTVPRTLRVGWGKEQREKVYLEDAIN